MQTRLDPELERRIRALEDVGEQGASFTAQDWLWLFVLGVVVPAAAIVWGWAL